MEQWAELRREHFVRGVSIKALARRTGLSRNTVRAALRSPEPPGYQRAPAGSKLDPFKDEIHRLLKEEPDVPGQRVRELIEPLGFVGGKTIVDDYLREVRPLFEPPRTYQRTVYRPGEICQFDLWQPRSEIPVGHGQTRKGWVVVACLGYSRAGAGALIFSKQTPELLFGIRRCLWSLGALSETLVWDRQAGLHAGGGRPTKPFAAFCGQLAVGWHFCAKGDPQAKGGVERLQGFMERSFEPGRVFANELDYQLQLDTWFDARANARIHKTLRARPIDRLADERQVMAPLPRVAPDTDRRWVLRVPPDPYLRFDSCDYSLDARLVGRRVEARVTEREVLRRCPGHWGAGLPASAHVRQAPHDHRARARPHPQGAAPRPSRPRRACGRGPLAGHLRPADRMSRPTTELAHLFRALKAPAAARALPKLAERARQEEWSYEQFIATVLKTEIDSRDSHGGQARIKAARFPAHKTLEEFDFAFQSSIKKTTIVHLGQLDFLHGRENVVLLGPPGTGKTHCDSSHMSRSPPAVPVTERAPRAAPLLELTSSVVKTLRR